MSYKTVIFILVAALNVMLINPIWSMEKDNISYQPITNVGKKWRIIYYQGGHSNNYFPYLEATMKGLNDLGWVKLLNTIPVNMEKDPKILWDWLVKNAKSDYIEFVNDGFYNANWNSNTRTELKQIIINRINTKKDVDLVIAMGTWAGIDLANNQHKASTMVMSSTDPVRAGIIKSNADSGYDHVFARVDPGRWERQIRIFHNVIGFKKLGVAYEDSVLGRSYAAIDIIEKVAKEKGFDIVNCFTLNDVPDIQQAGATVIKCIEDLITKVDAIYIVEQTGVNNNTIPKLVSIINKHHIPTFSQQGSEEVKQGFLMSIAREGGFAPVGRFLAISMAKIFNGAKPRQLNQVFEEKPAIALNLKIAEIIGLYLNADILAAADEVYRDIEPSPSN